MSRSIEKIRRTINKLFKRNKWKVYLYYKNQQIKKIYASEHDKILSNIYMVNIYFKRHLFGGCFVKTMFKAERIKFINKEDKKIYVEVDNYIGGEIE